jgi:hypothetical protein
MMKCNLKNRSDLIAAYLSEELSESDKLSFEKHYFECEECFAELKAATDAVQVIRQEGQRAFSKSTTSFASGLSTSVRKFLTHLIGAVQRRPAFVAAIALVVIVALSALIYFQIVHNPSGGAQYAAKFQPSPALESYMQQTLKSSQYVLEAHPPNNATFKKPAIEFGWTLQDEHAEIAGPLELRILNNKQKQLYSFQVKGNRLAFDEKLDPGLYYWALLSENEMIYLGRFFVRR